MNSIKDMVKDGKKAVFTHYKLSELWYETECGFKFPVPVHNTEEIGEATFLAEDKAMMLMRYIRKHVAFLEEAKADEAKVDMDATAVIGIDTLKSAGLLGKL